MKPDKIQIILGSVFFLGCIVLIVFLIAGKLRIANGIFYATTFVGGIGYLYTGLSRIAQASKEGQKIFWYKQPWILMSIVTFVVMVMLFVFNYSRIYG